MSARHRLAAATALTTAVTAGALAVAGPAAAAGPGANTFTGIGISSMPYLATINAESQAYNLAYSAGYTSPYSQCGRGASWVTNPLPNFYQANVLIHCFA